MGENNDLSVYHYGRHICPPKHSFGPAERQFFLFHYIVKGKGIYRVNGKQFALQKDEGFLIYPGQNTYYEADEKDPWEYYFIAWHGKNAGKIMEGIHLHEGYILKNGENTTIKSSLKALYNVKLTEKWNEYKIIGELYRIIAELARMGVTEEERAEKEKEHDVLNAIIDYINANDDKNITVEEISNHFYMHRSNLYRIFMKYLQIPVTQYIHERKMSKAANLLITEQYTAKEISERVGMNNYTHFCRAFKQHFSCTPIQFRRRSQQDKHQ